MSNIHEPALAGIAHPEWVEGRRLWMDAAMRDLIARVRFGDPVKGWEGDDRLALYWNEPEERWELWRLEDDAEYRFVCRTAPGVPFDERVIDALLGWDRQRRTRSLHDEIVANNDAIDAANEQRRDEWVAEDLAPRLHHALRKEL
jgi:hypothetical protein